MALLSKETLENLGHKLVVARYLITLLGIVAPIILLTVLSNPDIAENTIISDKALLPGLVDETWQNHGDLGTHLKTLTSLQNGQ